METIKNNISNDLLDKILKFQLKTKNIIDSILSGIHKSSFYGFNIEFADHRQYFIGDDIKYIDWRLYGRCDKLYIKQFENEANMWCYILLDKSGSMGYKSENISKLEYGSLFAACLSYLLINQEEKVGLITFDNKIRESLTHTRKYSKFHQILKILSKLSPSGYSDINFILKEFSYLIKYRGLILIISDLLFSSPDELINNLNYFIARKNEVIILHILDPAEINFPFFFPTKFKDMETKKVAFTEPKFIKKDYLRSISNMISFYKNNLRKSKIEYYFISTDIPLEKNIFSFLSQRKEHTK